MDMIDYMLTAMVAGVIAVELTVEYAIKTLLFVPWYIIKRKSIYSYPPLLFYAEDEVYKMFNEIHE